MLIPERRMVDTNPRRNAPGSRPCTAAELARRVESGDPLLYLRFSDGEFHSMFDTSRRRTQNADGHKYLAGTMGVELRTVFDAACAVEGPVLIEASPCWTKWPSLARCFEALPESQRCRLVHGWTWPNAVRDGSVFAFLEAARRSRLRKVLVSKVADAPVAEALGAKHVEAPMPNAYLSLDNLVVAVDRIIGDEPAVVLSSIGMASGCLLWRLWQGRGALLDFGHVPDALLGVPSRNYLRKFRRKRGGYTPHGRFKEWIAE